MTCDTAMELLSAKLDGELTAEEAARLDEHLAQCGDCRALLEELTAIHTACAGLEVAPPSSLKEQILQNLPAQEASAPKGKIVSIRWRRWGAMAASFALVALAAWHLPNLVSRPPEQVSLPEQTVTKDDVENGVSSEIKDVPMATMFTSGGSGLSDTDEAYVAAFQGDMAAVSDAEFDAIADFVTKGVGSEGAASAPEPAPTPLPDYAGDVPVSGAAVTSATPDLPDYVDGVPVNVNAAPQPYGGAAAFKEESVMLADVSSAPPSSEPSYDYGALTRKAAFAILEENDLAERSEEMTSAPAYCGVLTLQGDIRPQSYPAQTQENGEIWYELPCAAFFAFTDELKDGKVEFTLRTAGADVSSAAENGLVIVLP